MDHTTSSSDGPTLTYEKLSAFMRDIPKAPVFLLSHWLKGSVYLKCERQGRTEIRISPAAWDAVRNIAEPSNDVDPWAAPVTHEDRPPNDVLVQMLVDPTMREHVGHFRLFDLPDYPPHFLYPP